MLGFFKVREGDSKACDTGDDMVRHEVGCGNAGVRG